MRLDKFICKSTRLTKLQALAFIESGDITVNDVVIKKVEAQVHENNTIKFHGEVLTLRPFRYLLMHKPAKTICSNVDECYPSALNLLLKNVTDPNNITGFDNVSGSGIYNDAQVEQLSELHIAGRLDADTTGLILITDDGRWTFNITLPNNGCKKVYRVELSRPITQQAIVQFEQGIQLQGEQQLTLPASLQIISEREVLLTLTEGKFHQVKRMFAVIGNRVQSLHREQIGDVTLDVAVGKWRNLTDFEIQSFNKSQYYNLKTADVQNNGSLKQ
ncbi:16S rRNA pseudouridine(516) synthase [Psychromonas sp. SA13A]|uniref:pseudouridine synthase n=1 Tax=Psychromonas sp. SA13A TaxID=2686346 RepID=UPI00140B7EE7|nr:16S rRNA pseudouridine(516) synthase [Psychromonas sp. SA13A]